MSAHDECLQGFTNLLFLPPRGRPNSCLFWRHRIDSQKFKCPAHAVKVSAEGEKSLAVKRGGGQIEKAPKIRDECCGITARIFNDPRGTSLNLNTPRLSDIAVVMSMLSFIKRTSRSFKRFLVPLSRT